MNNSQFNNAVFDALDETIGRWQGDTFEPGFLMAAWLESAEFMSATDQGLYLALALCAPSAAFNKLLDGYSARFVFNDSTAKDRFYSHKPRALLCLAALKGLNDLYWNNSIINNGREKKAYAFYLAGTGSLSLNEQVDSDLQWVITERLQKLMHTLINPQSFKPSLAVVRDLGFASASWRAQSPILKEGYRGSQIPEPFYQFTDLQLERDSQTATMTLDAILLTVTNWYLASLPSTLQKQVRRDCTDWQAACQQAETAHQAWEAASLAVLDQYQCTPNDETREKVLNHFNEPASPARSVKQALVLNTFLTLYARHDALFSFADSQSILRRLMDYYQFTFGDIEPHSQALSLVLSLEKSPFKTRLLRQLLDLKINPASPIAYEFDANTHLVSPLRYALLQEDLDAASALCLYPLDFNNIAFYHLKPSAHLDGTPLAELAVNEMQFLLNLYQNRSHNREALRPVVEQMIRLGGRLVCQEGTVYAESGSAILEADNQTLEDFTTSTLRLARIGELSYDALLNLSLNSTMRGTLILLENAPLAIVYQVAYNLELAYKNKNLSDVQLNDIITQLRDAPRGSFIKRWLKSLEEHEPMMAKSTLLAHLLQSRYFVLQKQGSKALRELRKIPSCLLLEWQAHRLDTSSDPRGAFSMSYYVALIQKKTKDLRELLKPRHYTINVFEPLSCGLSSYELSLDDNLKPSPLTKLLLEHAWHRFSAQAVIHPYKKDQAFADLAEFLDRECNELAEPALAHAVEGALKDRLSNHYTTLFKPNRSKASVLELYKNYTAFKAPKSQHLAGLSHKLGR